MGVASGRGYQEVGVVSSKEVGLVSGCCCKEAYRYPHNNY